jgi:signal transduction histidine kinase
MSLRARLTLVYAVLFLVAGSALLALSYGLLADHLPKPVNPIKDLGSARLFALCKEKTGSSNQQLIDQCRRRFTSEATASSKNQHDETLNTMLEVALIGLGAATLGAAALGWVVSGRVLGPMEAAALSRKRFIANAAHELRTPLSAMRTALDVTLSKQPAPTPTQLYTTAVGVSRSVDQASAIIEALLTLAAAEVVPRERAPVDLAPLAEDALDANSAVIARRRLALTADTRAALTSGDRVLIERLVGNLVENAVRHNVDDGELSLSTYERDGMAELLLSNSGPLLDPERVRTLFEPFARGERTGAIDGVGLGLSIAEAVAQAHNATIVAQARAGGGLEVRVSFPR